MPMNWEEVVQYALPALAAGLASKQGMQGGHAMAAFTGQLMQNREREREQQRLNLQLARQAKMDQLAIDREQRLIDAEDADNAWREKTNNESRSIREENEKRRRRTSLHGAVKGAAKNPDFSELLNNQIGDSIALTTPEGTLPMRKILEELGIQPDTFGRYDLQTALSMEPEPPEEMFEYSWEDGKGNTVSEMMTKAQRARMGQIVKNRPRPVQGPKAAKPKVRFQPDLIEGHVTEYTDSDGSSVEMTFDEVKDMLSEQGYNDDDASVTKVMRNANLMKELLEGASK